MAPPPEGSHRVITSDILMEGVHFLRAHPPELLGEKALAVNFADLMAMAAWPEAFTWSIGLPEDTPTAWWAAFCAGAARAAKAAGAVLVGGDMVRSPGPLVISVTAWGATEGPTVLTRLGGRPGDILMVAGRVGAAGEGLRRWLDWAALHHPEGGWPDVGLPDVVAEDDALMAHLCPKPPLESGPWALALGARAGMDCSDGLATDLPRLAAASGVSIRVDLNGLPVDPALLNVDPRARALGGEDHGLLVLIPNASVGAFTAAGFHAIGRAFTPDDEPEILWDLAGASVALGASPWAHFPASEPE